MFYLSFSTNIWNPVLRTRSWGTAFITQNSWLLHFRGQKSAFGKCFETLMVTGLSIRDCAEISNKLVPRVTKVSAINVTARDNLSACFLIQGLCPPKPRTFKSSTPKTQMCPVLEPNTNTQRLFLLSYLLRSIYNLGKIWTRLFFSFVVSLLIQLNPRAQNV